MQDAEELRTWLRRKLATGGEWFETIWNYLEDEHWLSEYRRDPTLSKEDVFDEASRIEELLTRRYPNLESNARFPPPRRTSREPPHEVVVTLDAYSQRRAQTFSEVAAALAQDHPKVRFFRERFLAGRLLTNEEAGEFLDAGEGLEELRSLGKELHQAYRWREGDAVWFVLTGEPPLVPALSARVSLNASIHRYYPNTAEITLTVQPWVNADEVTRVYRDIQRQMLSGDNRRLEDRTLAAVRFVAQQIRERGAEPWSRRVERWNREHPKWRYASFRALRQVFERFVHPHFEAPKYEPYEPTSYQSWRDERRRLKFEQLAERMGPNVAPVNLDRLRGKD